MRNLPRQLNFVLCLAFLPFVGCAQDGSGSEGPKTVTIDKQGSFYQLLVDGEPYYIKGAGGDREIALLAESGANTLRTWGTDQTEVLIDQAHENGLMVAAGLWINHERHGFDYNDATAVANHVAEHKAAVDRFKDHPALLMWVIGNEVEINYSNLKVWDAIEEVAAYIKQVDPNHPIMVVTAHAVPEVINAMMERAPSVDIMGMNTYAGITVVADDLRRSNWDGPFIIGEWGPNGNWESPTLPWGAEIEPTSTEKAQTYALRYKHVLEEREECLGSFVFFWGQKQETTKTWFGLFTPDGKATEIIDVLTYHWSDRFPEHLAPQLANLSLNGATRESGVQLAPGSSTLADFQLIRGNPEELELVWQIYEESAYKGLGGDVEQVPEAIATNFVSESDTAVRFNAPMTVGNYRLFLQLNGPGNKAATANIPFQITNN
jgi:hypothetical protein